MHKGLEGFFPGLLRQALPFGVLAGQFFRFGIGCGRLVAKACGIGGGGVFYLCVSALRFFLVGGAALEFYGAIRIKYKILFAEGVEEFLVFRLGQLDLVALEFFDVLDWDAGAAGEVLRVPFQQGARAFALFGGEGEDSRHG